MNVIASPSLAVVHARVPGGCLLERNSQPRHQLRVRLAILLATAACAFVLAGGSASANLLKPVCGAAGLVSGLAGKGCKVAEHAGRLLHAGKKLLGGHVGGALKALTSGSATRSISIAVTLAAIGAWVLGGARFALRETANVMNQTTTPRLQSTWFSSTYWRMAGIAAVLTLPFLFAAAIQAMLRSDLGLLVRAAFGYLPLAMLAVGIAAPLTMLLLAASDELSAFISAASGHENTRFLAHSAVAIGAPSLAEHSAFLALLIGAFTVAAALVLWMELVMREAAVYILVLMLPLAFAALVWPARRVWATRAVELLVALVVSKFAIVAVLSLGGAAMTSSLGTSNIGDVLAGFVLVVMAAFTPWALLRLLPLAELASGAAGSLSSMWGPVGRTYTKAGGVADQTQDWLTTQGAEMRRDADRVADAGGGEGPDAAGSAMAIAGLRGGSPEPGDSSADATGGVPGPAAGTPVTTNEASDPADGRSESPGAAGATEPEPPPAPTLATASANGHAAPTAGGNGHAPATATAPPTDDPFAELSPLLSSGPLVLGHEDPAPNSDRAATDEPPRGPTPDPPPDADPRPDAQEPEDGRL